MKKIIFSVVILLLTTQFLYGENKDIENIRKWFKEINQKANSPYLGYSRFQMADNGASTEGGLIIAHVSKKKFKKITVEHLGEMGKKNTDYYFKDGKLFFVYSIMTVYNAPVYLTKLEANKQKVEFFDPKKSKKTTERIYLKDGKLIRWLDSQNKKLNTKSKDAKDRIKEINNEVKRIISLIKKEI